MRLASHLAFAIALAASACAAPPEPAAGRETVIAVTASNLLIRFNAGTPDKLISTKGLTGLQPGENVLGIDYRVARGWLYAVGSTNRLYRINTVTAIATPVGERFTVALTGTHFGVSFNPTQDRLRVVSDTGQSLRVNPDSVSVVDSDSALPGAQADGPLSYATGDRADEQRPAIVALAHARGGSGAESTITYALDAVAGTLVTLGNREGSVPSPAASPDSGHLFTVGPLGEGPFAQAAFDIGDSSGRAFAALTAAGSTQSRWVEVDLGTGAARLIGLVAGNEALIGIAIEP